MELKGLIAKAKYQSSLVASVSSTADAMVGGSVATKGGGCFGYYNKKNYPVFSGKYRDYPEFRKYWMECVQPKYEDPYQRHEIRQCVPEIMRPVLRNCNNMNEI